MSREVIELLQRMSWANPRWGAPRIHGELWKLGFELSQATVAKYLVRHRRPPSQNWGTFLKNHMHSLVSADFFVVPTITLRLLFVFVILSPDRRRPIHLAVTANPTTVWTTRQLLAAFPWDRAPHDLLRDRDACYGKEFHEATRWLGIREAFTAPRSPWQNPYVERLIGTFVVHNKSPLCRCRHSRHASATHLLAQGFSLKEIGDHLGHRLSKTTAVYAKVNLTGLREVANLSLRGLL